MSRTAIIEAAIREAAGGAVWSRGVALLRAARVAIESDDGDAIKLRVAAPGTVLAPSVTLFTEDVDEPDWTCSCKPREAACEHAVAAVLWLGRDAVGTAAANATVARIMYRLVRHSGALALDRLRTGEPETRLMGSVIKLAAEAAGAALAITELDIEIERLVGLRFPAAIVEPFTGRLLRLLGRADGLTLDGRSVSVSNTVVGWQTLVEDAPNGGFHLRVRPDPSISEVFTGGLALCGDVLRPRSDASLGSREQDLRSRDGRTLPRDAVAELVTELLPSLRERMPVVVRSTRLPRTERLDPALDLRVRTVGHELEVLATLVYGTPPVARIDDGRVVPLGRSEVIPLRDRDAEVRLVARLGRELDLTCGHVRRYSGQDAVGMAARLERFGTSGPALADFRVRGVLSAAVSVLDDGVAIDFQLDGDMSTPQRAENAAVLSAWREGASLVPLLDGGWAALPADWLARFGDVLGTLLSARDVTGAARGLHAARLCRALDVPVPVALRPLEQLLDGFVGLPDPVLPPDFRATLRPYQHDGVRWLAFARDAGLGVLLADDMGLGKTIQAMAVLPRRTLIVAPTSVMVNWEAELARFRPEVRVSVYHGPRRVLEPQADVTLTTYALLRLDAEVLSRARWECLILDEAQAIKNPSSQVAQAAFDVGASARWRLVMTGTPVENRLEELWSELRFLNPGWLGTRSEFDERFARPIASGDSGAAARLRDAIRPLVLRRKKRDVLQDLPPRSDHVVPCVLSDEERTTYDAMKLLARDEVLSRLDSVDGKQGNMIQALEALLRLRQAATHRGLLPGHGDVVASAKLEALLTLLEEAVADGHKALVFSQWTRLLDLVEPALRASELEFTRLDGQTADRAGVVARFQSEDGPPVMLLSLKAGGVGINLTAADHVILLDPWWNPAVEDQAADRAHRIGQTRPVMVHRLVAKDTVEERILALQDEKRALVAAALGEGAVTGALALTRDDLRALFD